ncbi:hypothetical protein QJS10_CPA08g00861 [Acorus calamus]|uniref:Uncharacterized protein n=1 Tax=Acorus calamus TaxID=4465 RepID=A0AAV9EAP8_ACOCL|nr:hypothetical protein QJS10_CPA08g00861 [Acorus calamus]
MASDATHVSVGAEGGGPIIPGPFPSSGTGCPPPPRSWNATSGLLAGCGVHDRIGKPVPSVPFVARISCGFMSTDDLRRPLSSPTLCGWGDLGLPAIDVFINQERKLGDRRRSDTVLDSTINDADQGSVDVAYRTPPAPYEKSKFLGSGGSMVARLKLKGIDGRAPPGVEPAA